MKEKKPVFYHSESAPAAERCVDKNGLCAPKVPSRNGRTFSALRDRDGQLILFEAEWNRVFYASAPIGCRGFFYGGNYDKSD